MCDKLHRRRIFVWITLAFDCQIAAVADDMRVCENSIATYDKASPNSALDASGVPWRLIIWLHRRGGNPHQAFLNRPVWFWRRNRNRDWNYCLHGRAGAPRNCRRRCLRPNGGCDRRALLCVKCRCRSSQQANTDKNKSMLHGRKFEKLKRNDRKSIGICPKGFPGNCVPTELTCSMRSSFNICGGRVRPSLP